MLQNDAPERVVFHPVVLPPPVLGDALAHIGEVERAVGDAERFPGEADGQQAGVGEDSAAHDEVLGAVEFEEEEFAGEEGAELAVAAGLPEIDFVELRAMAEEVEPLAIRYPDEGFHWKIAEFTDKDYQKQARLSRGRGGFYVVRKTGSKNYVVRKYRARKLRRT